MTVNRHPQQYLKHIGALIESPSFYPSLNARDHLAYISRIRKSFDPGAIETALDSVGLAQHARKPVGAFSLGMKQRLGIAMAIVNQPRLLILDEPTNGLDPSATIEIRNLVRRLADESKASILISSHLLHEIEQICNRVIFIRQGRIVQERVLGQSGQLITVQFRSSNNERTGALIAESYPHAAVNTTQNHVECRLSMADVAHVVGLLVNDSIDVYEVRHCGANLEEVYVQTFGAGHDVH
jgi:ABC-2 type transport system ATP-binding protein